MHNIMFLFKFVCKIINLIFRIKVKDKVHTAYIIEQKDIRIFSITTKFYIYQMFTYTLIYYLKS